MAHPARARSTGPLLALALLLAAGVAPAQLPLEVPGRVETLPPPESHWVWVADVVLERLALVDTSNGGRLLGIVNTGYGIPNPVHSRRRGELYVAETYYSRGTRGERTDVLTVHSVETLAPVAEVELPPRRALNTLPSGNLALSDDERFVAVFNMNPATSLSIVDVEERRFAGEITTPGCSLVYAAGPRDFLLLCMDGAMMVVSVDERGAEGSKRRTPAFFDPQVDPVTEKAVRHGDRWLFVSFDGRLHPVDVSGPEPRFEEPWSLFDEEDRAASWRIGGIQHLAVHQDSGRLYALVHQGGPDSHKQAGTEVWVYDLEGRERVLRIGLRNPGLTFMGESMEFGRNWTWPFDGLYGGLLRLLPSPGIDCIQVSQGAAPRLVTGSQLLGSLGVYDAVTGEFQKRVLTGNLTVHALTAPFGPGR